mmetsp:Transcript_22000/g.40353  ORF Transcript_22000/g.40353 Transcript_22000/m.40353 type:complete len:328 (+) Transcript_22000:842-1825(+)
MPSSGEEFAVLLLLLVMPDSSSSSNFSRLSKRSDWMLLRLLSSSVVSPEESVESNDESSAVDIISPLSPLASSKWLDTDGSSISSAISSVSSTFSKAVGVAISCLLLWLDKREIKTPPNPGCSGSAIAAFSCSAFCCSCSCCSRNCRCRSFILPSMPLRLAPSRRTPHPLPPCCFFEETSSADASTSGGVSCDSSVPSLPSFEATPLASADDVAPSGVSSSRLSSISGETSGVSSSLGLSSLSSSPSSSRIIIFSSSPTLRLAPSLRTLHLSRTPSLSVIFSSSVTGLRLMPSFRTPHFSSIPSPSVVGLSFSSSSSQSNESTSCSL